jgi:hypothetical protein
MKPVAAASLAALERLAGIATVAGEAILPFYGKSAGDVDRKEPRTPASFESSRTGIPARRSSPKKV